MPVPVFVAALILGAVLILIIFRKERQ